MFCLIRPPTVDTFRFVATSAACLPLGPAYIAAALERSGRRVHVLDATGEGPTTLTRYYKGFLIGMRLEDLVSRIPPEAEYVGISVIFTHEWPAVVHLIDLIKQARPELPVILGGEHIASMPEFSLITSKADYLVLGEGEETIVELLDALETGRPLGDVDGIVFREEGHIAANKRRVRNRQIDDIAPPAWDHFRIETYRDHGFATGMFTGQITIPILATRGCPYQCTYCSAPNMWLPTWIPRDPKRVVDEMERYVRDYGVGSFQFQDLTAIIKKDWIVRFCHELLDRGLEITWQLPTGTRSEAIDGEVADLLKKTGMICMSYAPESGSETTRKLIKKKMHTKNLFDSIRAAVQAELNVTVFTVIGFPHDRPEHIAENLPFIDRLAEAGVSDMSVGYFMALPGTELFHSLWDSGKIKLDRAYFRHILDSQSLTPSQSYCEALSKLDLIRWKFRMLRRFYASTNGPQASKGLLGSLMHALSGLSGDAEHQSKLQTAARRGLLSLWSAIKAQFARRWVSRARERELLEGWHEIYRGIREQKIAQGVSERSPSDTTELHKRSVVPALEHEHQTARDLQTSAS